MDTAPARSRGRLVFWAVVVVVTLLLLSLARTEFGTRALRAAGLSSPPTPYVELFFDDRVALPASLPPGIPVSLPVGFVLGNSLEDSRAVTWSVTQSPPSGISSGSEGPARLGVGERRVVQTRLTVRCLGPSIEITVQVVDDTALITRTIPCTRSRPAR